MTGLAYFCGMKNATFVLWDFKTKSFGNCFQWLCLTSISHIIFATVSAFLFGIASKRPVRSHNPSKMGIIQLVLCYAHAVAAITSLIIAYALKLHHPPAYVLSKTLTFSTWLLCIILHHRAIYTTKRAKYFCKRLVMPFLLVIVSSTIQLYDCIHLSLNRNGLFHRDKGWYAFLYCVLNYLFLLITLISIVCSRGRYERVGRQLPSLVSTGIQAPTDIDTNRERFSEQDALLGTHVESYDSYTFKGPAYARDTVLGWAEEEANFFSRTFFFWVKPLMKKGAKGLLQKADDLFYLPLNLDTKMIKEIFQSILRLQKLKSHSAYKPHPKRRNLERSSTVESGDEITRKPLQVSLIKALYRAFGLFYMAIGILKFLADCLAFAGPILLNYLVKFMENKKEPIEHGYYYALGLLLSTLIGALLNAQFNYQVNKVKLQCRAALITTVYDKALSVSSTTLSTFSTGQVINFMSTDTDRIINFCNSFHQFWSLPFQIAVALYLLYQQVGIAFLTGLGFAILLIPVNRCIAVKIMELSKRMMEQKDQRVKLISECLFGVRFIKFCAWEENFIQKIESHRKGELESLKGRKYLDALCVYFWATTPVLISILTFTTYVLLGHKLTAAKVGECVDIIPLTLLASLLDLRTLVQMQNGDDFWPNVRRFINQFMEVKGIKIWKELTIRVQQMVFTSIALFSILIAPLNAFPWVINGLMEAWVSIKRIEKFMTLQELNAEDYYARIPEDESEENIIEIDNGSFRWKGWQPPKEDSEKDDRAKRHTSEYDVIDQPFLLEDINLQIRRGDFIGVIGRVGCGKSSLFAAMTAEMERLQGQVHVADDLDGFGFANQDPWIQHMTIRENILFGQPFYHKKYTDVIHCCALEEDLAALPAGDLTEVGEHGVTLSGGQKARVALARAVYQKKDIYLLDDPFAAVDAHVAQHIFSNCIMGMVRKKTRILCTHHTKYLQEADLIIVLDEGNIVMAGTPDEILSKEEVAEYSFDMDEEVVEDTMKSPEKKKSSAAMPADISKDDGKLVEEEEQAKGVLAFSVYRSYWKAVGHFLSVFIIVFLLFMQGSRNISDWWLAYWISQEKQKNNAISNATLSSSHVNFDEDVKFYLTVYGSIAGANTVFTLFRAFLFAYGGIEAARVVHKKLLKRILKAPIAFFDVTPIGRIINRFSSDVYSVDDSLPFMLNIFLAQAFGVFGTVVITCYGIPWFAAVLVPLSAVYMYTQNYYRKTSRELKRIGSVTLSPIYEHFSETLSGLSTIRALRDTARFTEDNETKLDASQRANFAGIVASQWLMLRLQLIGVVMVTAVAFLAVIEHHLNSVDPGLVGLAIAYALSVTDRLSGLVTSFTETEKLMVSVERAQQYIDGTPQEEDNYMQVDKNWPQMGTITLKKVTLIYRTGLPPALDSVSLHINAGEKIGICGRTGSGKSSLLLVLFRMVKINNGTIWIDGVDTSNVSLNILRSKMAIIPQDPFLFDGSVRENLDPFSKYSLAELDVVLQRCHLSKVIADMGGMEASVGERGQNLSAGQRQLMCLARTLLRKSKIICIDEATASVDLETDKLIQQKIREEFTMSTVLTIAHRIETILDSDRVLVMDGGKIAEFDSPKTLLSDTTSLLYSLVNGKH